MNKPVCLILGAGAGIGGNVAKRFALEGYHACLARRSDKAGLGKLVAEIEVECGSASGFMLNAVEAGSIEQLVAHIEADVGPIALAVFNLGAQIGDGFVLTVPQVLNHLGFKGTFDQSFGQLLEKPVFSNEVFRLFVIRQQAVYQFVAYGHFSSFEDEGSFLPLNRLHKI